MGHIDDSLLVGYEFTACKKNVFDTVDTFCSLGFIVHPDKSFFEPTQEIEFLGFLLNNVSMAIRLPTAKTSYVKKACIDLQKQTQIIIRGLAHVIGLLVSSLPGGTVWEITLPRVRNQQNCSIAKK